MLAGEAAGIGMGLVMVGTGAPGVLGDMTEVGGTTVVQPCNGDTSLPTPPSRSMHVKRSMRKSRED